MTRRAGGRSGGGLHKMHKNAHIKKSLSESHELRVNSEKCHKMPRKKSNEARTNKEKPSILQHDNTGVGRMLREFMYTIRARQIGAACCPAGEFINTITRACPAAGNASLARCTARRRVLEFWAINGKEKR